MFEWMCHDKSESNARTLPNGKSRVFVLPQVVRRVGPIVQDATLIRETLRIPIHRCLNPLHLSETIALADGGSPQRKICAAVCRKSGDRKFQLALCVDDSLMPLSNLNVRLRRQNRRNRYNRNFSR
jgi:hypothetical protein